MTYPKSRRDTASIVVSPFLLFILFILAFGFTPEGNAAPKEDRLTVEELTQTKASQLFVTRQFAQALEEFRKLEKEYPKDIVVKRYIGACLDHLNRDEEAIAAFKAALKVDPNDLPSHQFLARIYLRTSDLDKAEEEFTFLVNNDKQGSLAAKAQLETIKGLREAGKVPAREGARELTPEEFMKTEAAKAFMNAKYDAALKELDALALQYPDDMTIRRYQGIVLDKLGRFDEALRVFETGLLQMPENIPLRYFMAQTLLHKQDLKAAENAYKDVLVRDKTQTYAARAQAELESLKRLRAAMPKKWSMNGSGGAEWNTNPTSKSKFRSIAPARGHGAWKFSNSAGLGYEIFKRGALSAKLNYNYSHSLYSNALNSLNTISNGGGPTFTYVRPVRGKSLIVQVGHTTTHSMVEETYYSTAFAQSLTLIYPFTDWYRATLSERWTVSTYNHEGTASDRTSRDGFGNVLSLTNNFYLNKQKTRYLLASADWGRDDTQGANNIKNYGAWRAALHSPLLYKVEGDLSFKFKDSFFPKYGTPNTSPQRHDGEYTLGVTLSRKLTPHWTLNSNYNYTNTESRDGNYTYRNHALGCSLSFYY